MSTAEDLTARGRTGLVAWTSGWGGATRGPARTPSVSVVIPTRNEGRRIAEVLTRIPAWVDEVVVVDAHSSDRTVVAARRARPDVIVVPQEGDGKAAALAQGSLVASSDIVVMLDADRSTDPGVVPRFVSAVRDGRPVLTAVVGALQLVPVLRLLRRHAGGIDPVERPAVPSHEPARWPAPIGPILRPPLGWPRRRMVPDATLGSGTG